MSFDANTALAWLSIALSICTLAGLLKTYFSSGEKELGNRLTETEKELCERLDVAEHSLRLYDRRIQATESELKHLPNKDMVTDLKIAMAELKGTVGTLGETVASVSRTVHRIDDYLREDAKP